ncbi:hypothetical protein ACFFOM_01675 [Microlunatus capsulatus]|uniref:DUF4352 domain-containing protein n=1 Tax=Microlunatus capsulatus TaxID=99117 RepID=A0ABS4Z3F4_9ACTN|nr:hypothetical protein [Microlunatus capsulatus]MBP2415570.1 hypothetical protein [Microlunatus capsulatus]
MTRRVRAGWATLLVCLLVVVLVSATAPDPAADVRRAHADVAVGQVGRLDHVEVLVERVRRSRSVTTATERQLDSGATLVLVDVRAAVRGESVAFRSVRLETRDGHRYEARPEVPALTTTQPGFTRVGTLVFEVPDARVAGARLVVDSEQGAYDVYSRAVRVDLALRTDGPPEPGPVSVTEPLLEVTP